MTGLLVCINRFWIFPTLLFNLFIYMDGVFKTIVITFAINESVEFIEEIDAIKVNERNILFAKYLLRIPEKSGTQRGF